MQVRAHATRDHTRISIDNWIRMELLRLPRARRARRGGVAGARLSRPSFAASRSISFNHTWCQHAACTYDALGSSCRGRDEQSVRICSCRRAPVRPAAVGRYPVVRCWHAAAPAPSMQFRLPAQSCCLAVCIVLTPILLCCFRQRRSAQHHAQPVQRIHRRTVPA